MSCAHPKSRTMTTQDIGEAVGVPGAAHALYSELAAFQDSTSSARWSCATNPPPALRVMESLGNSSKSFRVSVSSSVKLKYLYLTGL